MTKSERNNLRKLLKEAVFERDGHRCVRCGSTKRLSPSHIYPKGKYRKLEFEPTNILTLCYACHLHFWHKNPVEAWEWLKDYMPKEDLDWLKLRTQVVDKKPMDYNLLKIYLAKGHFALSKGTLCP